MTTSNPAAVIAELKGDPVGWARKCVTIRDKSKQLGRFDANGVQVDLYRRERRQLKAKGEVRQYILKARQAGITTWQQILNLHQTWGMGNVDALTIADKKERTEAIFEITTRAIRYFPKELLPTLGGKRAKEINFINLESKFRTDTAGAADPARGLTLGRFHGSEFAHWAKPRETLASATPSMIPRNSVIVLETTANMYEDEAHLFWRDAQQGLNSYEAIFYPWWDCDPAGYRLPLDEPDELFPLDDEEQLLYDTAVSVVTGTIGLDLEQIKWRRKTIRDIGMSLFLREYAEDDETCWMAAGDLFYEAALLKTLLAMAPTPIATDTDGTAHYRRHLPRGDRALLGADTSEGGAKDQFTYVLRGFPSGALIRTYASAKATPEDFADRVDRVGREFGFALMCIEKNFHGITVHRRLRDTLNYPARRIYHRVAYGKDNTRPSREMGWLTTADTKAIMLDKVRELFLAAKARQRLVCRETVKDAFAIKRDEEGKIKINGRDMFVADALCEVAREYPYLPLTSNAPPSVVVSPFQ